ncbi:MAG: hypothetical protein ACK4P4_23475 [Allorhizobium sp.]
MLDETLMPSDPTLAACDKEPIHIPGSIQPYGVMLVTDREGKTVVAAAGPVEDYFGAAWQGADAGTLLGVDVDELWEKVASGRLTSFGRVQGQARALNAVAYRSGDYVIIELEPRTGEDDIDFSYVYELDMAVAEFERVVDAFRSVLYGGASVPGDDGLRAGHDLQVSR